MNRTLTKIEQDFERRQCGWRRNVRAGARRAHLCKLKFACDGVAPLYPALWDFAPLGTLDNGRTCPLTLCKGFTSAHQQDVSPPCTDDKGSACPLTRHKGVALATQSGELSPDTRNNGNVIPLTPPVLFSGNGE